MAQINLLRNELQKRGPFQFRPGLGSLYLVLGVLAFEILHRFLLLLGFYFSYAKLISQSEIKFINFDLTLLLLYNLVTKSRKLFNQILP